MQQLHPDLVSPAQFRNSLADGKHWIVIDNTVYDVSCWCESHPGGKLVLLHSSGRDVTEAFKAYHPSWVRKRLTPFKVGLLYSQPSHPCAVAPGQQRSQTAQETAATVQDTGACNVPETLSSSQVNQGCKGGPTLPCKNTQQLTAAERLKSVQSALEADGLFQTSAAFYIKLAACCTVCLALSVWCVVQQHISCGAILLGLFWQQVCPLGSTCTKHSAIVTVRVAHSVVNLWTAYTVVCCCACQLEFTCAKWL